MATSKHIIAAILAAAITPAHAGRIPGDSFMDICSIPDDHNCVSMVAGIVNTWGLLKPEEADCYLENYTNEELTNVVKLYMIANKDILKYSAAAIAIVAIRSSIPCGGGQ